MKSKLSSIARPCDISDPVIQKEYEGYSEQCEKCGYSIKLLQFIKERLLNEKNSFENIKKLSADPLSVLISAKVEPFINNSIRFLFVMYNEKYPYVLSNYFDKMIIEIGNERINWNRTPDSLEIDCVEYIIKTQSLPLNVTCVLYPNFPLNYYSVSDGLQPIVGKSCECFAKIIESISNYISSNGLIENNIVKCDEVLRNAFNTDTIHLNQLPFIVRYNILPIQPLKLTFTFDQEHSKFNFNINLPNLMDLPQTVQLVMNQELIEAMDNVIKQKEYVNLLAAVERNPFEAIEAVITRCSTFCELSDESNDNGPKVSIDQMNPARRSTPFYWQSWVSEYAPKFLEENKQVHERYLKPQKPRNKKK